MSTMLRAVFHLASGRTLAGQWRSGVIPSFCAFVLIPLPCDRWPRKKKTKTIGRSGLKHGACMPCHLHTMHACITYWQYYSSHIKPRFNIIPVCFCPRFFMGALTWNFLLPRCDSVKVCFSLFRYKVTVGLLFARLGCECTILLVLLWWLILD
jgi:hypothetical protein